MIGDRYIDGDELMETLDQNAPKLHRSIRRRIVEWLKGQPRHPKIVSRQGAAEILGIQPPHLSRLKDRLPEPLDVGGSSWPVYLRSDIEALAKELKAEKKAKAKAVDAA